MKKVSTLIYFVNKTQPERTSVCRQFSRNENALKKAEKAEMEPSEETINFILGFAKAYDVIETERSGPIETNLN